MKLRRRSADYLATFVAASLSTIVIGALVAIFAYLVMKGADSLNWAFLTQTPKPVGEPGGGMVNALLRSIMSRGISRLFGLPCLFPACLSLSGFLRK